MGDFAADALRAKYNTDFVILNGGGTAVFSLGNNVATTTVTGESLWLALENGVSKYPTDGRFPQISGFRFAFDPSQPVGSRITSVTKADGTPIAKDGQAYSVTSVEFMVNGGDGYGTLGRDLIADESADDGLGENLGCGPIQVCIVV